MNPLLIVNPTSGPTEDPELLNTLLDTLKAHGIHAESRLTTPDEDGQSIAAAAAKAGVQLVIAAGGDGTIESIARGLIHTSSVLGIIPLGTRNNIAASLNIPTDLDQAVQVLVEGKNGSFDVGKANNHYFMEVVGVGLEASLFPCGDEVKEGLKKNYLAAFRSVFAGIRTFLQFEPHRLVLRFDGRRMQRLKTLQVNICNSPRYGVAFTLAPEAKMNDGKLDVIYMDNASKWEHLRHFFIAMQSEALPHERLRTYQVAKVEVVGYPPLEVHADGECLGQTPVTIEVVPNALQICVPTLELQAKFTAGESSVPASQKAEETERTIVV